MNKISYFVEILAIIEKRIELLSGLFTFVFTQKRRIFRSSFSVLSLRQIAVRLSDMHHLFSSMSCEISFYKHSIGVIDLPVSVVVRQIPLYV